MKSIYKLLICVIFLSSFQALAAQSKPLRRNIFNKQFKASGALGWQASSGGRSWTEKDLENFHKFLNQIVTDKGGSQLLKKWGIRHDCFDAVLGIHLVYALTHGLAVNYGKGLNSIKYKSNPAQFIVMVTGHLGTLDATRILYGVDLLEPKNISTGLVYVYGGRPGHAMFLVDAQNMGMFKKVEGPYPASHAKLAVNTFFQDQQQEKASFRRFPLYIKTQNGIKTQIPQVYPESKSERFFTGHHMWFKLLELKFKNKIPKNSKKKLNSLFVESLCSRVNQRIDKVNSGLRSCYLNLDPVESQCNASKSSDYSTPSFDKRFESFQSILEKLKKENLFSEGSVCGPFNVNRGLETYKPKYIQFELFNKEGTGLAPYISEIIKTNTDTIDPMANQQDRWACYSSELENCLGKEVNNVDSVSTDFSASDYFKVISEPGRLLLDLNIPVSALEQVKYLYIEDEAGELVIVELNKSKTRVNYKVKTSGMHNFYLADEYGDQVGKSSLIYQ